MTQLLPWRTSDASPRSSGRWVRGALLCLLCLALTGCDVFQDPTPPPPPLNLSTTSQDGAVTLDWSPPIQTRDLDGYNVYRDTTAIESVSTLDPVNGGTLVRRTIYTDTTAQNKTTYRYVVTAVDSADNESAASEEVRRTPFSRPPGRPGG